MRASTFFCLWPIAPARRVCHEAGATVTTNALLRVLDVVVARFGDCRSEVNV